MELYRSIYGENVSKWEELLKNGLDPDIPCMCISFGYGGKYIITPLYQASSIGNFALCELLLKYKANPNIRTPGGTTPLWRAAAGGHLDVCQLLIKHNADPNIATVKGSTPLTAAGIYRHYDVFRYLLMNKNVDCSNVGNYNAYFAMYNLDIFHHASQEGDREMCQKIIHNH